MSKEIATTNNTAIIEAMKNSLYLGAKDESVLMVLAYCAAAGLDPMTKPVHIVPMNVTDSKTGNKAWRDVVMPGIELYRTKAARTKEYAGCSSPEFGPVKVWEGVNRWNNTIKVEYPEWCEITVKRVVAGHIVEFTAREIWLENYANDGKTDAPNAMWSKRPFGQLAKCAEAQALRKGFPEVGAHQTVDEMAGKEIEQAEVIDPTRGMKPETAPPQAKKTETKAKKKAAKEPEAEPQQEVTPDQNAPSKLDEWKAKADAQKEVAAWWVDACREAGKELTAKQYGILEKFLEAKHGVKF